MTATGGVSALPLPPFGVSLHHPERGFQGGRSDCGGSVRRLTPCERRGCDTHRFRLRRDHACCSGRSLFIYHPRQLGGVSARRSCSHENWPPPPERHACMDSGSSKIECKSERCRALRHAAQSIERLPSFPADLKELGDGAPALTAHLSTSGLPSRERILAPPPVQPFSIDQHPEARGGGWTICVHRGDAARGASAALGRVSWDNCERAAARIAPDAHGRQLDEQR